MGINAQASQVGTGRGASSSATMWIVVAVVVVSMAIAGVAMARPTRRDAATAGGALGHGRRPGGAGSRRARGRQLAGEAPDRERLGPLTRRLRLERERSVHPAAVAASMSTVDAVEARRDRPGHAGAGPFARAFRVRAKGQTRLNPTAVRPRSRPAARMRVRATRRVFRFRSPASSALASSMPASPRAARATESRSSGGRSGFIRVSSAPTADTIRSRRSDDTARSTQST